MLDLQTCCVKLKTALVSLSLRLPRAMQAPPLIPTLAR